MGWWTDRIVDSKNINQTGLTKIRIRRFLLVKKIVFKKKIIPWYALLQ